MKIVDDLVVRKGDTVEFISNNKGEIFTGKIVKYPSNAQITVEIESGAERVIKKSHITEIVNHYVPPFPQPKVRTEKEQQRINDITTKVSLYLKELEKELQCVSQKHKEMVKCVRYRVSPRAVSEMNNERIRLERLSCKIVRYIDPIIGKFDSDIIRIVCQMVDNNKIDFNIDK